MTRNSTTYDVFVAYSHRDAATADEVADILRACGLAVFAATQQSQVGENIEDVIWQAMAESHALVVVLPRETSPAWLAFELGAARAWNKPIYAVSAYNTHTDAIPALREIAILPVSRASEIAQSIRRAADSLSEADIGCLLEAYSEIGVPVDQLLRQPQQLERLVRQFNKSSGRQLSGEQVMWHMLRLRKQARMPTFRRRSSEAE